MQHKKVHIGLVDDHSLFRSGIARLLDEFDDIVIDFEAGNGKELQKIMPSFKLITDVILMDITMPGMDGYSATEWVKTNFPHVHVIALSMYEDEPIVIRMLKAGAGGYVFKESKPYELYKAIIEVKQNGYYISEQVTGKIVRSLHRKEILQNEVNITEREREFLVLCVSELTYKEIAAEMSVATRTVDNYRESLFEKLAIKSRTGLAIYALKNNIAKL